MADVTTSEERVFTDHQSPVTGPSCFTIDLGLIGYGEAAALQKRLVAARKASAVPDLLLLCEHPHVVTLGRSGKREHLLASDRVLQQKGVEFHSTDRGGDITYHGPGQIVGYPILNLAAIRRDVGWYVRKLEETMIRAAADFGIAAHREVGKTGIWVAGASEEQELTPSAQNTQSSQRKDEEIPPQNKIPASAEKLGAIGVHLSRWVTSHGFAFNVSTDLRYFDLIVPCGIADRKATSLEKLLAHHVDRNEVAAAIGKHFGEVFSLAMKSASREKLFADLQRFEQPEAMSA